VNHVAEVDDNSFHRFDSFDLTRRLVSGFPRCVNGVYLKNNVFSSPGHEDQDSADFARIQCVTFVAHE